MLSIGALAAPSLLIPRRSFFLPPTGGWIHPIGQVVIPESILDSYMDGIKSGKYTFELLTNYGKTRAEISYMPRYGNISMWWEDKVDDDGKFHSKHTGRAYDFDIIDNSGRRAFIDDNGTTAAQFRARDAEMRGRGLDSWGRPRTFRIPAPPASEIPFDAELSTYQEGSRMEAAIRAAEIRARWL